MKKANVKRQKGDTKRILSGFSCLFKAHCEHRIPAAHQRARETMKTLALYSLVTRIGSGPKFHPYSNSHAAYILI